MLLNEGLNNLCRAVGGGAARIKKKDHKKKRSQVTKLIHCWDTMWKTKIILN